jgi:hypothetical protein
MFNNINKKLPLIVEGCLNISYIDNLFMALFYKPSYMQNILSNDVDDLNSLHLQNMIYYYFVNNMRMKNVITSQLLNEIRNYSVYCGWKNNSNFMELFGVDEYYRFLADKFNQKKITIKKNNNVVFSDNYINLDINKNNDVKEMLNDWLGNFGEYNFDSIPDYVPINLNRMQQNGKISDDLIDIKKAIKFEKNNIDENQKNNIWVIQSVICNDKHNYYSIIRDGNNWFMYSNSKIPSLMKIDIKDEDIMYKIKKECVFLVYEIMNE